MDIYENIFQNEKDWNVWLEATFKDIYGHEEPEAREEMRGHPPDSYPCVIVWSTTAERND